MNVWGCARQRLAQIIAEQACRARVLCGVAILNSTKPTGKMPMLRHGGLVRLSLRCGSCDSANALDVRTVLVRYRPLCEEAERITQLANHTRTGNGDLWRGEPGLLRALCRRPKMARLGPDRACCSER
ncbi:hypothetical protein HBI56_196440 [Parastagonospora nodorum]|uniref:Uncharacterized protein n=1 Tax=Phaeosphaeria nodorum (strain SN15 / ATCC MYA-4574 / FGSC 10173) TaxID=321614 RepID=A0A7U2F6H2_PHANO|nr:hypothetical protein HBH56_208390 [Parastagonospora nodorum]QRC99623.1 hypothetical protein JI435_413720 [Parastagonospora nodorum SN15]KAH3923638.1 hypothetical protein HBH54_207260 [Parastagonospora nodorum]KAH3941529.1 hypothetical protein HBH53_199580 [Parastagonospora nodorum]KAH3960382.1 hypothetical protein HBH51_191780 [Parastagonospora nodorum]